MTYLPFVAASYGLTALVLGGFALAAWSRLRSARERLGAIDPRAGGAAR